MPGSAACVDRRAHYRTLAPAVVGEGAVRIGQPIFPKVFRLRAGRSERDMMLPAELLDDGWIRMLDQLQELGRGAVRRRGGAELPLHGAGRTVYPQHLRAAAQKQPTR